MTRGRSVRLTTAGGCASLAVLLLAVAPAAASAHGANTARTIGTTTTTAARPRTRGSTTTTLAPTTTRPVTDPFAPVTTFAPPPARTPSAGATAHVSIVDFGFSPSSITVTAGTTVVWTNTGQSIHSVTSDSGAFDSSPTCPTGPCIDPGATYSHTFSAPGTFAYHCRVHSNMTAVVVVQPATSGTTTTVAGPTTTGAPGVSAGGAPSPSTTATGAQLAFTGSAPAALWLALGALLALAAGLALRPRRRPFPVPVSDDRPDRLH